MNFKINKSDKVFSGRVFDVKVDQILYDSGNNDVREIIVHNGGAVVLPVTKKGNIIMVKQYRYPIDDFMYELPAGKLEINEDPLECASRELTEETGYSSNNISYLGKIYTSPGFCTETLFIYLAEELLTGDHNREEGEHGMEVFEFPVDEVNNMIADGKIVDSKSICAIHYYSLMNT